MRLAMYRPMQLSQLADQGIGWRHIGERHTSPPPYASVPIYHSSQFTRLLHNLPIGYVPGDQVINGGLDPLETAAVAVGIDLGPEDNLGQFFFQDLGYLAEELLTVLLIQSVRLIQKRVKVLVVPPADVQPQSGSAAQE